MRLAAQQFGSGSKHKPDVILIHGTGGDANLWQPQVKLLVDKGFRCILPELRGHGGTADPYETCDLSVHVSDVLETLEYHQVKFPAIFVGHSLGAIISVTLAEQKPELFQEILAVSLPGRVPQLTVRAFKLFLKGPYHVIKRGNFHERLSTRSRTALNTDIHSLHEIVKHLGSINLVEEAFRVTCPVHFAVGRLDIVAPYYHVKAMHRLLPNSTLKIFEWAGHSCMDDRQQEFNQWFMEKIMSATAKHATV
jgi:pimeloyl-ACP methyl ester carboxylesterase